MIERTTHTPVLCEPMGGRYYRLKFMTIRRGRLFYIIRDGFVTNFRSGPQCDRIIDQIGNEIAQCAYIVHDANYTPQADGTMPMSRKDADSLLKDMLIESGMSKLKATMVYWSVRMFGGSAYGREDDLTKGNRDRFTFISH